MIDNNVSQTPPQPLPSEDAWIVSANRQEPRKVSKGFWKWLIVGGSTLVVLVAVERFAFLTYTSFNKTVNVLENRSNEMTKIIEEDNKPQSGFSLTGKVEASYENPFDEESSYSNPFDEYENP